MDKNVGIDCSLTFKSGFDFVSMSFSNHPRYIKIWSNTGEFLGLYFIQKCFKFILNRHPYWESKE